MKRLVYAKETGNIGQASPEHLPGVALLRPLLEVFSNRMGVYSAFIDSDGGVMLSTLPEGEDTPRLSQMIQSAQLAPLQPAAVCGLRVAAAAVTAGGRYAGSWLFCQPEQAYLQAPACLDRLAEQLPRMAAALGDILDNSIELSLPLPLAEPADHLLLHHMNLQGYISDTFTTLLCFTDADEAIEYALASIGRRFDLSRVCIFENSADSATTSNTYEWCAPGVVSIKEDCQDLPYLAEGHGENFNSQGIFTCEDTASLPPVQSVRFVEHHTHAILQCQLMVGQEPIGMLSFDECRRCRSWDEAEIASASMLAKILTTLILRRNMYATLIQAMEEMVEREQRIRRQLDLQDSVNKMYEEVFTSDNTQDTIDRIFEMVGKKYRVSRLSLWEAMLNRTSIVNTAEWCAPGAQPRIGQGGAVAYAEYEAFCRDYHDSHGSFYCEDTAGLECGLTGFFKERSIVSTLQTSIRVSGSIDGFISVEECTGRRWSQEEVAGLKLTTRALAAIVLRNRERDKLEESHRITDIILHNVNTWVYVVDAADFSIKYINKRMELDLASPVELGLACYKALQRGQSKCTVCPVRQLSESCNVSTVDSYDPQRGIWYSATGSKVRWVDGSEVYIVAVNDIGQQKSKELKIQKTAFFDPVLKIKNRAAFVEDFDSPRLQGSERKNVGAVIIFDVNDFKYINQTFGLSAGDGLLRQIASYLTSIPNTQGRVYRYGGDEFLLILEGSDVRRAEMVAATISKRFEQVWRVDSNEYYCTIAMGIALYPEHGGSSQEMIGTLDFVISEAKSIGRGSNQTVSFYNKLGERLRRKHMVMDALKQALKQDGFEVHYQPIYSPDDRTFTKMEALLRLKTGGEVMYPSEFIPVAEESGLIKEIGLVVLDKVCAAIAELLAAGVEFKNIHVNISAVQLMQDDFADQAMAIIHRHEIPPHKLEFEITESVLSSSIERVRQVISQLLQEGVAFAIDDFGTGYSNFTYIFSLPFNILKFDKTVVSQLEDNAISSTIIRSIISNCHEFGIRTVAEGIETLRQYRLLRSYGCDFMQGYFFAKPVPEEHLRQYFGAEPLPPEEEEQPAPPVACVMQQPRQQGPAAAHGAAQNLEESLPGGIYRCKNDLCRTVLSANSSLLELLGCTEQQLMEGNCGSFSALIHPDDRKRVAQELALQLGQGPVYELEYRTLSSEGRICWLLDQGRMFEDGSYGQHLQGVVVDITRQRSVRDEYEYICFHDPLTGLYNRAYFEREIAALAKLRGIRVGLIYCDLDGLKLINDNLGHEVGDKLLISAGDIIAKSVEREDIVCRMGGDEFAVILMDCTQQKLLEKMEAIRSNVSLNNQNPDALPVRISIGSASAVTNEEGLLEKLSMIADGSMYEDKRINITAARNFILKRITQLTDKKLL